MSSKGDINRRGEHKNYYFEINRLMTSAKINLNSKKKYFYKNKHVLHKPHVQVRHCSS